MQMRSRSTKAMASGLLAAILVALTGLAFAQEMGGEVTVDQTENEQYGTILTDAEGRSLYLFRNEAAEATDPERMTEGVRANAAACEGGCLENWPAVTGESVVAGEGVDDELLYTADVNGTQQVVYNGWPLYYFANDAEPGQAMGQGLGGADTSWQLVTPEGTAVGDTMDGAAVDDAATDDAADEDDAMDDGAADDSMGDDSMDDATEDDAAE